MRGVRWRAWLIRSVYTAGALGIVLREDGHILLVKPRYREGWGLVGGFMRPGEQAGDTMRRELFEEAGLVVDVDAPAAVYLQPNGRHIDHLFVIRLTGQARVEPRAKLEIGDIAWSDPAALPPLQPEACAAFAVLRDGRPPLRQGVD
jgi:ADP-ribose pyrophosphatase YjhB (NUDIX family)